MSGWKIGAIESVVIKNSPLPQNLHDYPRQQSEAAMPCPYCEWMELQSKSYVESSWSYCMDAYSEEYRDGILHQHNGNSINQTCRCSNDHTYTLRNTGHCNIEGCDYGKPSRIKVNDDIVVWPENYYSKFGGNKLVIFDLDSNKFQLTSMQWQN